MAIQKITSGIIADGAIVATDIADGTVTTAKIADGSITSTKIAAGAATPANGSINIAMLDVASSNGVGALQLPAGTDAQRPSGELGYLRYNTSNNVVEVWNNSSLMWEVVGNQTAPLFVEYLVLAGGGGGGTQHGGGGGAGGLIYSSSTELARGTTYTITVGSGGSGSPAVGPAYNGNSTPGGVSSFDSLASALGGGGGGSYRTGPTGQIGYNGGSGGGGGSNESDSPVAAGSGTPGQGNPGGNGRYAGGGGGGAGAAGTNVNPASPYGDAQASNGAIGLAYSISGSSLFYAGGGGGGTYGGNFPVPAPFYRAIGGSSIGGTGGLGPMASPAPTFPSTNGTNGTANRGSGGGGGANFDATGGNGSGGVVIIRYSGAQTASGGTVTTSGSNTIHTFTSSGSFTTL